MGDLHSMAKTLEKKVKEVNVTVVSYAEFTGYDFQEPAVWWILSATGDYYYFHCAKREDAQLKCDQIFDAGFYKVKTSRIVKTKSKQEGGGLSCYGTNSRKGFAANLRPS
jgi:hypothetical protein